ncbi:MAG TPA: response regulator [Bdellovibrionota bacterium]|nr:response regulator [Bdellovibrionota bacterium]
MATGSKKTKFLEILLVENSSLDARLTTETFKDSKFKSHLHVLSSGEEALSFLRRQPPYEDAIHPDLILLDLKLQREDGYAVLKEIKEDPKLKQTPVIILTGSEAREDVLKSYGLYANSFVTKPLEMYDFLQTLQAIEHYWLNVATLPPR